MSTTLVQRQLSIVAAAMLAAVIGLAVASRDAAVTQPPRLARPPVADVSAWYTGLAGVRTRPLAGAPSGCGTLLDPKTLGVGHSVLPCGAKLFIAYHGKTILTTVVDRGPFAPGHDFEVTPALADVLGLSGVQTIRWTFARA